MQTPPDTVACGLAATFGPAPLTGLRPVAVGASQTNGQKVLSAVAYRRPASARHAVASSAPLRTSTVLAVLASSTNMAYRQLRPSRPSVLRLPLVPSTASEADVRALRDGYVGAMPAASRPMRRPASDRP